MIDLNADVGEGSPADAELLDVVTSVNVAGGGHAGGGELLEEAVRAAADRGVAIGAHPSYPDRAGFGRHSLLGVMDAGELWASVTAQVVEVGRACARHGTVLRHVKAHGALYHDVSQENVAAQGFLAAIYEAELALGEDLRLTVVGRPAGALHAIARSAGRDYLREAFADRGYREDGSLLPRGEPGAVLDAPSAAAQALRIARDHHLTTAAGTLSLEVETLCVHSDTPGAGEVARDVRSALEGAGISVRSARG